MWNVRRISGKAVTDAPLTGAMAADIVAALEIAIPEMLAKGLFASTLGREAFDNGDRENAALALSVAENYAMRVSGMRYLIRYLSTRGTSTEMAKPDGYV